MYSSFQIYQIQTNLYWMLDLWNHYFGFSDDQSKLTGGSTKSEDNQTTKNDSEAENISKSIAEDKDLEKDASNESVHVEDETVKFDNVTSMATTDAVKSRQAITEKKLLNRQQHDSIDEEEKDDESHRETSNNFKTVVNGNENVVTSQQSTTDKTYHNEDSSEVTFNDIGRERRFASLVNALLKV